MAAQNGLRDFIYFSILNLGQKQQKQLVEYLERLVKATFMIVLFLNLFRWFSNNERITNKNKVSCKRRLLMTN